jgi:hypothetical protein
MPAAATPSEPAATHFQVEPEERRRLPSLGGAAPAPFAGDAGGNGGGN